MFRFIQPICRLPIKLDVVTVDIGFSITDCCYHVIASYSNFAVIAVWTVLLFS